jgi:hypothetical protein
MSRTPHTFPKILTLLSLLAVTLTAAATAQEAVPAKSLEAASYQLFEVHGSGMSATLQVTETAEGGARLVLSLPGTGVAASYSAALYRGDCGPDRPLVLRLTPFDIDDNPLESTTETEELGFADIAEADLFVYLFAGEEIDTPDVHGLDGRAVACGEVGLGANR